MAYFSTVDERYVGRFASYPAGDNDAPSYLNNTYKLAEGDVGYGSLFFTGYSPDRDTYSLGALNPGRYEVDVNSFIWDYADYPFGSLSGFRVLDSSGVAVGSSDSHATDIIFDVETADTFYVELTGNIDDQFQYSVSYTQLEDFNSDADYSNLTYSGSLLDGDSISINTPLIYDADGTSQATYTVKWYFDDESSSFYTSESSDYPSVSLIQSDVGRVLKAQVTFRDDRGHIEVSPQFTLGLIENANDDPVGIPAISGTPFLGQTLTVNTTGISDTDGLGAFSYQWFADDMPIDGATESTYTLTANELDTQISVEVTYTDQQGTEEGPLVSTPTEMVEGPFEPTYFLSVSPTLLAEGESATVTVTRDQGSRTSSFNMLVINEASPDDSDYLISGLNTDANGSGVLTFAVGELEKIITIETLADGVAEAPETIQIAGWDDQGLNFVSGGVEVRDEVSDVDDFGQDPQQPDDLGSVVIGGSVTGTIEAGYDRDAFYVPFESGRDYLISLEGVDTEAGTLSDPYIWHMADSDGNLFPGSDDNSGTGRNAQLLFSASGEGGSYVIVGGSGASVGSYTLRVNDITGQNMPATGAVFIEGDALQGETLSANTSAITDQDGLGTFNYQWFADGVAIEAATEQSFTLSESEIGSIIEVAVSFSDALGNPEGPIYSEPTAAVQSAEPVDDYVSDTSTTGVVPVDGSITGNLESAFDQDWFALNLEAGSTYLVDLEGLPTARGSLEDPLIAGIYDASGNQVAGLSDDDGGSGLNSRLSITAETSGVYYVAAAGFGDSAGTYMLSVTGLSAGDDYAATPSTTGTLDVGGSRSGEIETAFDEDWFAVQLTAGSIYQVDLEGEATNAGTLSDPYFAGIYNVSGVFYNGTANDDGGDGLNSRLIFEASETGTYFFGARAYGTATGAYTLQLTALSSDDFESNTETQGAVSAGGSATGAIEAIGDSDWFRVSLNAGTTYQIDLEGAPTSAGTLADTYLEGIYTSDGALISDTANDDGGEGRNSLLSFTPTADGTYFISASAYGNGTGSYRISVAETAIGTDDFAANLNTTGSLAVNGSQSGDIETSGDVDWFRVNLEQGQVVRIDLEGASTSEGSLSDTYLAGVYDATGQLISGTTDDDGGTGYNSRLTFSVPDAGAYYIAASGLGSATGSYRVSVDDVTPEPTAGEFDIVVDFAGDTAYLPIFERAAARWEEVITGDLLDVASTPFGPVDDLLINASVVAIDGESGILGRAGADYLRTDGTLLPIHGIMQFDSADMAYMQSQGTLEDVILHEMGHVLGFSSWFFSNLGLSSGTQYTGESALAYYESLTGQTQSYIPLENDGGSGTAYSHWEESIFDTELMTGYAENSPPMPLSVLTIGALEDLGYTVDATRADDFTLSGAGLTGVGAQMPENPVGGELGLQSISTEQAATFAGSSYTYAADKALILTAESGADKLEGVLTQFTENAVYFIESISGQNQTVRLDGTFEKNNPDSLSDLKGWVDQITFFSGIFETEQSLAYEESVSVDAVLSDWLAADSAESNWISVENDGSFDDSIAAGAGDDRINTGDGNDTVTYESAASNYVVFVNPENSAQYVTIDLDSKDLDEGRDVLENVENLSFNGEHVAIDSAVSTLQIIDDDAFHWDAEIGLPNSSTISASEAQLYRTYFGALQRQPDDGGYTWWLNEIESGREDLKSMAAGFLWSEEFLGYVDALDGNTINNEVFLTHMYEGVFGRAPDGEGYQWWLDELESGKRTQVDVLVDMTQSNEYVELTMLGAVDYLYGSYSAV